MDAVVGGSRPGAPRRPPVLLGPLSLALAPDWVCEVIAPTTERIDRSRKMRICAREGVAHLWRLGPVVRTLEVLELGGGRWVLLATHSETTSSGWSRSRPLRSTWPDAAGAAPR
jgi:Uma2 family endonuclease